MIATIAKWGNGHGIHLPEDLMEQAGLAPADKLAISVAEDSSINLRKIPQTKAERFLEIYGDYQGDWRCGEWDVGVTVGKENVE